MSHRALQSSRRSSGHSGDATSTRSLVSGGSCALLILALAAGCSSTHGQMAAFLRTHDAPISTGHYTVRPPDSITIHAPGAAEIDGIRQRVRPDGKVALRLLGEVQVAGLTTQAISEKLRAQLSRYYVEPEVVVEVNEYSSQSYYVFGEVQRPGPKPYTGRDGLLRALAEAVPTFLAWRSQIRVVRPSPTGEDSSVIVVDLDRMIRTGKADQDVMLQPGDIIEVPPTPLAWIGHRVRELLYPIEPAVSAYVRPAEAMRAHHTYEGRDYYDDDD
jgi:polysaccharide export outer membrane protein